MVVAALADLLAETLVQAGVLLVEAPGAVVLAGVVEARLLLTLVAPVPAATQVALGEAPIAVALLVATLVDSVVVIPVAEAPVLTGDSNQ